MKQPKPLIRSNEEISIMIYPHMDIYDGQDLRLDSHVEQLLENEKNIIFQVTHLPSVRSLLKIGEEDIVTLNNYGALVEKAKKELTVKNLPVEILDFIYVTNYDQCASMLPNNIFPISSILTLNNSKNAFIYGGHSNKTQQRWSLVDNYETKIKELSDCTDEKFVAKQLEPLQQKIMDFDKNNVEALKEIKVKEEEFNQYLTDLGLKATYDGLVNNTHQNLQPEVTESQNNIKKPKKTAKLK